MRKLVVAVGGASGAIYAKRLLDALAATEARKPGTLQVGVCFSASAEEVWRTELDTPYAYSFRRYGLRDFSAPFASGSAGWEAMVVVPCSMGALGRFAHGVSDDLIGRAADVMLKERRKLVLVARETPLSLIHLENMVSVTRAGAVVLPAAPSFYARPTSIEALVDTVTSRILDQLGIGNELSPRWGQGDPAHVHEPSR